MRPCPSIYLAQLHINSSQIVEEFKLKLVFVVVAYNQQPVFSFAPSSESPFTIEHPPFLYIFILLFK